MEKKKGTYLTINDPATLKDIKDNPNFISVESRKIKPNGHCYKVGDKKILTGLVDFPEYNGEEVEITAIREDGLYGKAYYVKGRLNEVVNWVYEFKLK